MALLVAMPAQEAYAQSPGDGGAGSQGQAQLAQGDPPSQVARISVLMGNVSVEPASVDQFSAAEVNYPLTTGDRLYTDAGANAELETDRLAVRLGQQTDLTVTAMTDTLAQFGLASGSVHLRSYSQSAGRLDPGATVELDTPNVAVTVLQPGDVRVDVAPERDTTVVAVVSGQVQVDGNGVQQALEPGQRVNLGGSNPVAAQWLYAAEPDGLDSFSADRDDLYESSVASEEQYVNPETIGAEDLSANGDWETDADEGPVWYPSGVGVGWEPYSCGNWTWVAPWGWTWVECEAWGFAPFHYGRWKHRGGRWGWIPGPPVVRPVYSPAMVVFVGRSGLMDGGTDVTAWFPLGLHETYVPWYHASPLYVNRVNVSNIYDRNTAEVKRIYNQPTVASVYAVAAGATAGGKQGYANRPIATVVVSQASFAAGKPVGQSLVRVSPQALASAPVLPHPLVTPQRTLVVSVPARAVPARVARPTLASRVEQGARPAGQPAARPAQVGNHILVAPAARQPAGAVRPQTEQAPVAPAQTVAPVQIVVPAVPAQTPRPLFHNAVPPEPRPSFEEQQRAIETIDPGRPLGPQQLENLRQNRPAGPPQQPEAPHPAPAQRSVPAPRPEPSMPRH